MERYRPNLRYLLTDEGGYQDEVLAPLKNLVASLFRLENSRTPEDLLQVLRNLLQWLQSPAQRSLERDFTLWLKRVLLPARLPGVEIPFVTSLQEMNSMLAERVVEWAQQWKQQGIQQGIQKGIQEGIQFELKNLPRNANLYCPGMGFMDKRNWGKIKEISSV